jgi:hypothetical protein
MYDPCACKPDDVHCSIAGAATLIARPAVVYALNKTFFVKSSIPPVTADITRGISANLTISPSGNLNPTVQYAASLALSDSPPPVTQPAILTVGIKAEIKCTAGPYGVIAFYHESKAQIKAKSTVRASLNVSLRLDIFEAIGDMTLGLSMPCTALNEDYGTYVTGTLVSDIPLKLTMRANAGVHAILTGPPGGLTQIGRANKRKLRWRATEHPDSTEEHKKYAWRLTVADKYVGCGCQFIHAGFYDLRKGIWRVNTEAPVMLLMPEENRLSPWFPPDIYPQYTEEGNYRIVNVMNKMYDIYPPVSFVEYEIVGKRYVESPKSATEFPRFVFVFEGCGNSFFLINAECE